MVSNLMRLLLGSKNDIGLKKKCTTFRLPNLDLPLNFTEHIGAV